jgi:hydroxymethylbilane synthase
MSISELILGTRGSKLALAQSGHVAKALEELHGIPVRLQVFKTRGDLIQDRPLPEVGGKGLFTAELEAALLEGSIHLAVHSLKDLPTEDAEGLVLAAHPPREDPRDALVGSTLEDLAQGAVVGTGSARRAAQLQALRPDLDIRGIRGNVDTRIAKMRAGDYDAVVLACAGLSRLGLEWTQALDIHACVPATGQGALGVQCAANSPARALIEALDDPETRMRVEAERAFLEMLGGGCSIPAGCHAWLEGEELFAVAMLADPDGRIFRLAARGEPEDAAEMGAGLAEQLAVMAGMEEVEVEQGSRG